MRRILFAVAISSTLLGANSAGARKDWESATIPPDFFGFSILLGGGAFVGAPLPVNNPLGAYGARFFAHVAPQWYVYPSLERRMSLGDPKNGLTLITDGIALGVRRRFGEAAAPWGAYVQGSAGTLAVGQLSLDAARETSITFAASAEVGTTRFLKRDKNGNISTLAVELGGRKVTGEIGDSVQLTLSFDYWFGGAAGARCGALCF